LLSRAASEMLGGVRTSPCRHTSRLPLPAGILVCLAVIVASVASCVEPPQTAEEAALDVCAIANDGDLCDDHQACTYPDVCMNKKCVGMPVADGTRCTDGNVCTTNDHCTAGVCVATVEPDGTVCTDGDPCTDPDICQQGVCQSGGPLVCDDGNACTIDSCEPGVGCVFSPRDCAMPPDAGADAMMTPDSGGFDAVPDLGSDLVPDGPAPDAPPTDTGVDTGTPDASVDADAAVDAVGGSDADAADGQADAFDGAVDFMETPPDFRVRGGGCACAIGAGGDGDGASAVGFGVIVWSAMVIGVRRGRARRRGRGRG